MTTVHMHSSTLSHFSRKGTSKCDDSLPKGSPSQPPQRSRGRPSSPWNEPSSSQRHTLRPAGWRFLPPPLDPSGRRVVPHQTGRRRQSPTAARKEAPCDRTGQYPQVTPRFHLVRPHLDLLVADALAEDSPLAHGNSVYETTTPPPPYGAVG